MNEPLEHVLALSEADWVRLERIAGRFEEAWRAGERPAIAAFLPHGAEDRA